MPPVSGSRYGIPTGTVSPKPNIAWPRWAGPVPTLPVTYPKFSTLVDSFHGASLAQQWINVSGNVSESSGGVTFTNPAGYTGYNAFQSVGLYDLVESSIFVRVSQPGNESLGSWEVAPMHLILDSGNKLIWYLNFGVLANNRVVNGVFTQMPNTLAYNQSVHRYFRIRETGGTIFWDWSSDATTWTNLNSIADPFVPYGMYYYTTNGTYAAEASDTAATFDNLNVVSAAVFSQAFNITQASTALLPKTVGKPLPVTETTTTTTSRALTRTISLTQASTVTAPKNISKFLPLITEANATTVVGHASRPRTLTTTQASTVSLPKTINKTLSVTETTTTTLSRALTRTLNATQATTTTIKKTVASLRTVTQTSTATLSRTVGKLLSATEATTATIRKTVNRTLGVTEASAVTLVRTVAFARTLTATQAQTVSLARQIGKTLTATQAQTVTRKVQVGATRTITEATSVSLTKGMTHPFTITQASTATVGQGGHVKTFTVTQPSTVTRSAQVAPILSVSQAQSLTIRKAATRTITLSQPTSVALQKTLARLFTTTQASSVTLSQNRNRAVTLLATQTTAVSFTFVSSSHTIVLSTTQGSNVSLSTRQAPGRTLTINQPTSVKLNKIQPYRLTTSVATSVTMRRSPLRVLIATQSAFVFVAPQRGIPVMGYIGAPTTFDQIVQPIPSGFIINEGTSLYANLPDYQFQVIPGPGYTVALHDYAFTLDETTDPPTLKVKPVDDRPRDRTRTK